MQLTPHFSLGELTVSETAKARRLDNTPSGKELDNLKKLAEFLEKIRSLLGCPMTVNSAYRSPQIEILVSGKAYGQHMRGEACDFVPVGVNLAAAYYKILNSDLPFDQLIYEKPNKDYGGWLHVSIATDRPARRQPLVYGWFTIRGDKMKYLPASQTTIP